MAPAGKRQTRSKTIPVDDTYSLIFYVKGDAQTNRVLVSRTDVVGDLVETIRGSRELEADRLDVHCKFWKVGRELKPTKRRLAELRPTESDVELLNVSQLISDLWEEGPPAECVHVFVDVPERPTTGTNQDSRRFLCLVVDNIGKPRGPLPIKGTEDGYVLDLAESILRTFAIEVAPVHVSLWKPLSFDKSPQDAHPERVKDFLEAPDHRGAVPMEMSEQLRVYFPPDQPLPPDYIHIIAQLPPGGKDLDKSIRLLEAKDRDLPFEQAITFTIPSKARFPILRQSDLDTDEVKFASGVTPFFEDILFELRRQRVVPSRSSFSTLLSEILSKLGISFDDYFTNPQEEGQPTPDEDVVTDGELFQYLRVAYDRAALNVGQFRTGKEEQIAVVLLRAFAGESKRRSKRHSTTLGEPWSFPLIALALNNGEQFRYTPKSDFSLQIEGFPHCILEVTSSDGQADCWRMILQASCLARLGNELRSGDTTDTTVPVVIMAVYIDPHLRALVYLVYQPDLANKEVECHETIFNLTEPRSAFDFMFRLYNFVSRAASDHSKFKKSMSQELKTMANFVKLNLSGLTSLKPPDQPGGDGGGGLGRGRGVGTKRGQDPDLLGDPVVQDSLKAAGYEFTPTDPMLVPMSGLRPNMRDATSLDGSRVVFKVVDGDTHELEILKYLNEIKEAANHAIELHGVVDVTVATVIALPWRLPLNMYFNPSSPPKSAALFPEQFLEGVAFLHAHKVAHLDLKPGNVVIEHPQRLIIIDFDLSIFVEDESTTTKGFRGTPPWVAPEVGTRDGPEMSFSPILADRWACGRMVRHLEALEERPRGDGDGRRYRILEKLMSENPRSRPSLKDALDGNGRRWVKRIAEAEKSGGGMQKKPRMIIDPEQALL